MEDDRQLAARFHGVTLVTAAVVVAGGLGTTDHWQGSGFRVFVFHPQLDAAWNVFDDLNDGALEMQLTATLGLDDVHPNAEGVALSEQLAVINALAKRRVLN
jgi:hypothetical protein